MNHVGMRDQAFVQRYPGGQELVLLHGRACTHTLTLWPTGL